MTAYEQQIINVGNFNDKVIKEVESEDQEILASYITSDYLHEKIHNPFVEGIDEG